MAEKKTLDLAPFQVDLLLVFWCFMYTTSSTIDSETKITVPSYSERKSLYVTFCSFGSRTNWLLYETVNASCPSGLTCSPVYVWRTSAASCRGNADRNWWYSDAGRTEAAAPVSTWSDVLKPFRDTSIIIGLGTSIFVVD